MQKILILDFGSQYTQLIARRVREMHVYCEIVPFNKMPRLDDDIRGVILSGSPFSVRWPDALRLDLDLIAGHKPMLGICYGAQLTADFYGGEVAQSAKREYGKVMLQHHAPHDPFFAGISKRSQVWMSHSDSIVRLPEWFEVLGNSDTIPYAAFRSSEGRFAQPVYGIQFHPEVFHSLEG
ncbi:MAG TPA: glutamine-hydrolyzing GMP synthase, partial [Saprospiraceae bacterium]|nr:glutamine-hydrolyzing GMP synthase [Saprospiraceae bacterium]